MGGASDPEVSMDEVLRPFTALSKIRALVARFFDTSGSDDTPSQAGPHLKTGCGWAGHWVGR